MQLEQNLNAIYTVLTRLMMAPSSQLAVARRATTCIHTSSSGPALPAMNCDVNYAVLLCAIIEELPGYCKRARE